MAQILLYGRDRTITDQITEHLNMHRLEVITETSADAILAELSREDVAYAALIADAEVPGIDIGILIEKIREISRLPVMLIAGEDTETAVIRGLESGADFCFARPVPIGTVAAQVLALIRMQERLQSEEIRRDALPELRGIRMDPVRRRVRVRGKEKKFTRKEFDLLYFLMQHPEKVYTKEDLYREVWHEEAVGGMATVVMHIKKIRNIIEEKPAQPKILKTDWGVGYYFAQFDEE